MTPGQNTSINRSLDNSRPRSATRNFKAPAIFFSSIRWFPNDLENNADLFLVSAKC